MPRHLVLRMVGGLVLAALILLGIGRLAPELSPSALAAHVSAADPALLIGAFCAYLAVIPLRATRWSLLVRDAGGRIGIGRSTLVQARAWLANVLLPARLGDLSRSGSNAGHGLPVSSALGTIASERLADLAALAGAVVVALAIGGPGVAPVRLPLLAAALALGGMIGLGLLVVRVAHRHLPGEHALARQVGAFAGSLRLGRRPRTIATVLAISLVAWSFEGGALMLGAEALGVRGLSAADLFIVAMAAALLSALPFTPAGLGLLEGGMLGLLTVVYRMPVTDAGAIVAIFRVITLAPIVAVGIGATVALAAASRRGAR